jgi:uncharacterized protein YodC (DUF2158 family)
MDSPFKAGDLVALKSGGPTLCVTALRDESEFQRASIEVHWFADNSLHSGTLPADSLKPAYIQSGIQELPD